MDEKHLAKPKIIMGKGLVVVIVIFVLPNYVSVYTNTQKLLANSIYLEGNASTSLEKGVCYLLNVNKTTKLC